MEGIIAGIAVSLVLIISFCICNIPILIKPHETKIQYLFKGNKIYLAISSNVGTLFSLSIFFGVIIGGTYVLGSHFIFIFVGSFLFAYTGLIYLLMKNSEIQDYFYSKEDENKKRKIVNNYTLIGFIGQKFERRTLISLEIIALFLLFGLFALELALARLIFNQIVPTSPINPIFLIFILAVVCLMYVYIGGYVGVLRTDLFQLLIIIAFFGFFVRSIEGIDMNTIGQSINKNFDNIPLIGVLSATLFSICWFTASLDVWIRNISTLNTNKLSRSSIFISMFFLLILFLLPFCMGIIARNELKIDQQLVYVPFGIFSHFLSKLRDSVPGLFLFYGAITCAAITTLDTYMITASQTFYDFGQKKNRIKSLNLQKIDPRSFLIFFCVISAFVSLMFTYKNYATIGIITGSLIIYIFLFMIWRVFFSKRCHDLLGFLTIVVGLVLSVIALYFLGKALHFSSFNYLKWIPLIFIGTFFAGMFISIVIKLIFFKSEY